MTFSSQKKTSENGNMLFMILIAVVLIGLLTAVIMSTGNSENANIDDETLVIRASEAQRYASEVERAVMFIMQGHSESDIRFAHPEAHADYGTYSDQPTRQVFHPDGGAASFRKPPANINDGSAWEFYGGTAVPGAGSNRADLVAVLPNVTQQFCDRINKIDGQTGTPADSGTGTAAGSSPGDCVHGGAIVRFDNGQQFYNTPNVMDEATFEQDPNTSTAKTALEACVVCAADSSRHFYHVLLAR